MEKSLDIRARITGMRYKPFLCRELRTWRCPGGASRLHEELDQALASDGSFILDFGKDGLLALSWWVSAKRTRSYPYARVYDTLNFPGKRVTVIPIFKDEGREGDRDFLQWDTVALMSLLGIYTIISYYNRAERSTRYANKITHQRFDLAHLSSELQNLLSYQSDALHWNMAQIGKVGVIAQRALEAYARISKQLGIPMHSIESAQKRVAELQKGRDHFMQFSRSLAQNAQSRERVTIQPKENLRGTKATLTIQNYLGGNYYFTCDEAKVEKDTIFLIEGKHSKSRLPSLEDIKDGLVKMMLFTNLEDVQVGNVMLDPIAVLKLTSPKRFRTQDLNTIERERLGQLKQESTHNHFQVLINERNLGNLIF